MDAANILIVEDNTTVAEDARECLESLGYVVTAIAASGDDAIELAGKDRPDAVLMDIRLRGPMDGIEAADRIHAEFDIPVLFLSAYSDRDLLGRAKQTGSFGYLVKPFEERELYAMLEMTLFKARTDKERRKMEARMAEARKMEAIGRMAGGIAHFFNNMLFITIGNLDMAQSELPQGSDVLEHITEAWQAARRAAYMSRLMLTYLGHDQIETAPTDLSGLVGDMLQTIRKDLPAGTIVEADLPLPGPVVLADSDGMEQILRALVVNAAEAMEGDFPGRVTVSVETAASASIGETHRFPVSWEGGAPTYACLAVADSGKGMDPETISTVFDPFFTDKFTGRGLGLAVVLGMVRAHDGCITVESAPGRGSTFRVFLPLSSEPVPPASGDSEHAPDPISEDDIVLLVDDQKPVRDMAEMMLLRLGFPVIPASSGEEAAAIFREKSDRIRLVISDLSMPGMDGWETLAELRRIRPDIPVILTSGYNKARILAEKPADQPQAFLEKPYQMKTLKETIRRVLGQLRCV